MTATLWLAMEYWVDEAVCNGDGDVMVGHGVLGGWGCVPPNDFRKLIKSHKNLGQTDQHERELLKFGILWPLRWGNYYSPNCNQILVKMNKNDKNQNENEGGGNQPHPDNIKTTRLVTTQLDPLQNRTPTLQRADFYTHLRGERMIVPCIWSCSSKVQG